MILLLDILARVTPPCASLPRIFPLQFQSKGTRDIISRWSLFNNTFPFTVSLPLPLPFPLPVLSLLRFPLPILCSIPFPSPCLTALRVLRTLAVVIVVVITGTAPSIALRSGICPGFIIIILIMYLISIQWPNGQDVACLVLPAACRLNLCRGIIATIRRETHASVFNLSRAGCPRIRAIDFISKM